MFSARYNIAQNITIKFDTLYSSILRIPSIIIIRARKLKYDAQYSQYEKYFLNVPKRWCIYNHLTFEMV